MIGSDCALLATRRYGSIWMPRGNFAPPEFDAQALALATFHYTTNVLLDGKHVPFVDPPAHWGLYSAGGMIAMSERTGDFFWEIGEGEEGNDEVRLGRRVKERERDLSQTRR
jgi:hypothetical protein